MAKGTVVVIKPDGYDTVEVEEPISLQTMYELIDCQMVQAFDTPINDVEMISDEEAKLHSEVVLNPLATALMQEWIAPGDFVAGTVVLCTNKGAEWAGLNEPQLLTVTDELSYLRRPSRC
jgi:hypothetical protein